MDRKLPILATALTVAVAFDAGCALAQPAAQVDEIIVTARKREESLQEVPISITALSAQALRERGVQTITDVARFAPNLSLEAGQGISGGSSSVSVYIRGIGQNDSSPTADPGVAIYVDGVYLGRSVGALLDVIDLERVEVLRGPQGTLFGKNTIGGAISLVSAAPTGELGGYLEGAVGRFAERALRAVLNVPVSETVQARISLAERQVDGYARSLATGERFGGIDHLSGRLVVRWVPSDALTATLAADVSKQRDDGQFIRLVAPFNPVIPSTVALANGLVYSKPPFNSAYDSRWLPPGKYVNYASRPGASDLDQWGASATLVWRLSPEMTLTSISAFRRLKTHVAVDGDASPLPVNSQDYFDRQEQFSQELRVDGSALSNRLAWTVGAYVFDEDIRDAAVLEAYRGLYPAVPNPGLDFYIFETFHPHNVAYAGFGQATFRVTPKFSVTGGLRYNYEHKTITAQGTRLDSGTVFLPPLRREDSWRSWTPKISAEYQVRAGVLAYASVSQGFKSGGVNYQVTSPSDFTPYDPEKATTYEIGLKSDLLERRLRVNLALFDTRYTDMQLRFRAGPGQFRCPTTAAFCSFVINADLVKVRGGELEVTAIPVSGLELSASAGNTHEAFKDINPLLLAGGVLRPDTRLPKTPEWTYTLGAQYRRDMGLGVVTLRTDYAHRSDQYVEIGNSPRLHQGAYGLLSARVSLADPDGRWEAALSGQNLTNEFYMTSGSIAFASTGVDRASFAQPRTWTASLRYRF